MSRINRKKRNLQNVLPRLSCLLAVLIVTAATGVDAAPEAYPFNKGRARLSFQAGSTRAFDQNYTAVGLGVGYYVRDGLEAGLDGDAWFGSGSPDIYRVSPGLRYVFYPLGQIKPYAGIFYRRTFIEEARDHNETGGRAGVTVLNGPSTSFSAGLVYDMRINCDKAVYSSCSDLYSEISLGFLF